MSTFAARMHEAHLAKVDARRRGESIGDYRGTVAPRTGKAWYGEYASQAGLDQAKAVMSWCDAMAGFAADLDWIVLELNDPTLNDPTYLEIPF